MTTASKTSRSDPGSHRARAHRISRMLMLPLSAWLFIWAPAGAQTAAPPVPTTLKIGVIGPFTGASADFGIPMLNGIEQAVDEINAVGGYLGRKLEIVRKDDQASPDVGVKLSQELVADKVVATIGFCNTGVAAKSLEVYQNAKMPLIIHAPPEHP